MTFDDYQEKAKEFADYPIIGHPMVYPFFGLPGEVGEVFEKTKKLFRDTNRHKKVIDEDIIIDQKFLDGITKEIGDVLWYMSQIATELNLSFDNIASANISKLSKRKAEDKIHGEGDDR